MIILVCRFVYRVQRPTRPILMMLTVVSLLQVGNEDCCAYTITKYFVESVSSTVYPCGNDGAIGE